MREAYIYDAVRTPRGRGKKSGTLNEVRPIDLLAQLFRAFSERNGYFDTTKVDDVVIGCVTPLASKGVILLNLRTCMPAGIKWYRECKSTVFVHQD
jgi:acetyl-CoA C-acetyltransferase